MIRQAPLHIRPPLPPWQNALNSLKDGNTTAIKLYTSQSASVPTNKYNYGSNWFQRRDILKDEEEIKTWRMKVSLKSSHRPCGFLQLNPAELESASISFWNRWLCQSLTCLSDVGALRVFGGFHTSLDVQHQQQLCSMVKSEPQNRRDAASVVTLVLLAPSSVPPGSGGSSQSEAAGRVSGKESGLKGLQMSLKTHSNERGYSANFC